MKNNFTLVQYLFTFAMYLLGACLLGTALFPSFILLLKVWALVKSLNIYLMASALSFSVGVGFFIFGISLSLETILLRYLFNLKLKEGEYSYSSPEAAK